jgi:hypothetical protein
LISGLITEGTEKLIIVSLVNNLVEKSKLALDSDISFSRTQANSPEECLEYLVVGDTHAGKLAAALTSSGARCQFVQLPIYRASTLHAGKLKEGLAGKLISPKTILVLQLFDNAVYMTATDEGGLIPLSKDVAGKLHCFGELVFAPKELQWKLFSQVANDLKEFCSNTIVILAPLPRYLDVSCCSDEGHMPNRKNTDFKKKMEDAVFQCRANLKDFAFRSGMRRAKTISTWNLVRKQGATWADPVNLDDKHFEMLAAATVAAVTEISNKRAGGDLEGPPAKRNRGGGGSVRGPRTSGRGGIMTGRGGAQHTTATSNRWPPSTQSGGRGGGQSYPPTGNRWPPPTQSGGRGGGHTSRGHHPGGRGWNRGRRGGRGSAYRGYN